MCISNGAFTGPGFRKTRLLRYSHYAYDYFFTWEPHGLEALNPQSLCWPFIADFEAEDVIDFNVFVTQRTIKKLPTQSNSWLMISVHVRRRISKAGTASC